MTKRLLCCFLLFAASLSAQTGYNASRTFITSVVASDISQSQTSHISYHQVAWIVTNAPASCTFTVDSSVDGVSWTAGGIIPTTTYTAASGTTAVTLANANYIRLNATALTAASALTLNYTGWASNPNGTMAGLTGAIGGGALLAGACATGTATVTGAGIGMPAMAAPSDGTNIAALGTAITATVTSANVVTVSVCALLALTPTSKTYAVRVIP